MHYGTASPSNQELPHEKNEPLVELIQAGTALFRVGSGKPPTRNAGSVSDGPALVEEAHQEGLQQAVDVGSQVFRCHLTMTDTRETLQSQQERGALTQKATSNVNKARTIIFSFLNLARKEELCLTVYITSGAG